MNEASFNARKEALRNVLIDLLLQRRYRQLRMCILEASRRDCTTTHGEVVVREQLSINIGRQKSVCDFCRPAHLFPCLHVFVVEVRGNTCKYMMEC